MADILIVDDTAFVRFVLRKYLEKLGHNIVGEAVCENSAVKLYEDLHPDIVTLDINLECQDCGFCVLQKIMEIDPNANVIMISSCSYKEDIIKAVRLGAKGFIAKPVNGKALKNLLHKIISTSSKPAAMRQ